MTWWNIVCTGDTGPDLSLLTFLSQLTWLASRKLLMYFRMIQRLMCYCNNLLDLPSSTSLYPPSPVLKWCCISLSGTFETFWMISNISHLPATMNCHNPSPSQKSKGLGVTLFQWSSNFHSRLTWPRVNDFRTNQEPCPPQIQLHTWRTG